MCVCFFFRSYSKEINANAQSYVNKHIMNKTNLRTRKRHTENSHQKIATTIRKVWQSYAKIYIKIIKT